VVGQPVQVVLPRELVQRAIAPVGRHEPHERAGRGRQAQRVYRHKVCFARKALAPLPELPRQAGADRDDLLDYQLLRKRGVGHQAPHYAARQLRPARRWSAGGRTTAGSCLLREVHVAFTDTLPLHSGGPSPGSFYSTRAALLAKAPPQDHTRFANTCRRDAEQARPHLRRHRASHRARHAGPHVHAQETHELRAAEQAHGHRLPYDERQVRDRPEPLLHHRVDAGLIIQLRQHSPEEAVPVAVALAVVKVVEVVVVCGAAVPGVRPGRGRTKHMQICGRRCKGQPQSRRSSPSPPSSPPPPPLKMFLPLLPPPPLSSTRGSTVFTSFARSSLERCSVAPPEDPRPRAMDAGTTRLTGRPPSTPAVPCSCATCGAPSTGRSADTAPLCLWLALTRRKQTGSATRLRGGRPGRRPPARAGVLSQAAWP